MREFSSVLARFRAGNHFALLLLPDLVVKTTQARQKVEEVAGDELIDLLLFVLLKLGLNKEDVLALKYFKGLMEERVLRYARGRLDFCYSSVWQAAHAALSLQESNAFDLTPLLNLPLESDYKSLARGLSRYSQAIKLAIDRHCSDMEEQLFSLSPSQFILGYKLEKEWQQSLLLAYVKEKLSDCLATVEPDFNEHSHQASQLLSWLNDNSLYELQMSFTKDEFLAFDAEFTSFLKALSEALQARYFKEFVGVSLHELLNHQLASSQVNHPKVHGFFTEIEAPLVLESLEKEPIHQNVNGR